MLSWNTKHHGNPTKSIFGVKKWEKYFPEIQSVKTHDKGKGCPDIWSKLAWMDFIWRLWVIMSLNGFLCQCFQASAEQILCRPMWRNLPWQYLQLVEWRRTSKNVNSKLYHDTIHTKIKPRNLYKMENFVWFFRIC